MNALHVLGGLALVILLHQNAAGVFKFSEFVHPNFNIYTFFKQPCANLNFYLSFSPAFKPVSSIYRFHEGLSA
jgi:hypothetical protein